jgi:ABC-type transporter Mla subunit MlaD
MSPFRAGLIALVVIVVASYFGFTKANPFANPFELRAVFETANNLQPGSPVRIAGIDVGKVTKVEPLASDNGAGSGSGAAKVSMEIKDKGLPIHSDAELKVRPRIFLEGNFFVDLEPGSPSRPKLHDGATVPVNQTAAPVQLGDVLSDLQADTRQDLRTLLREYAVKGLGGGGAKGFRDSIKYWESAFRNTALVSDAALGEEPPKDVQRVLKGQQTTFAALDADRTALKDLVTNLDVTAGALAREDTALEASIPALRDTLKVGYPALRSLNDALPSLRSFARDALPGVRSADPTLKAALPFVRQLRGLVAPGELRGAARVLRTETPGLVRLIRRSVPLLEQVRALSACTNGVLVPFIDSKPPDPAFSDLNDQSVNELLQHALVGLSGESRLTDANLSYFHTSAVLPGLNVRPAPPPDGGHTPPAHRPDVPCETQEPPNLNAPGGPLAGLASKGQTLPAPANRAKLRQSLLKLRDLMRRDELRRQSQLGKAAKR